MRMQQAVVLHAGQAAVRGRGDGGAQPPAGAAQPRRAVRGAVPGRPAAARQRKGQRWPCCAHR